MIGYAPVAIDTVLFTQLTAVLPQVIKNIADITHASRLLLVGQTAR
jgi:hypothetical protein